MAGRVGGCKQPELPSNSKMTNFARMGFESRANLAPFYHKQLLFCKRRKGGCYESCRDGSHTA